MKVLKVHTNGHIELTDNFDVGIERYISSVNDIFNAHFVLSNDCDIRNIYLNELVYDIGDRCVCTIFITKKVNQGCKEEDIEKLHQHICDMRQRYGQDDSYSVF
jgi:hypothetical protein